MLSFALMDFFQFGYTEKMEAYRLENGYAELDTMRQFVFPFRKMR